MKIRKRKKKNRFSILMLIFIAAFFLTAAGDTLYKNADTYFLKEATTENGRMLILVNSDNRVPEDYEVSLITLANGERIDKEIYPSLQKMFDDMRAEGYYPQVVSGYRSEDSQADIYESRYDRYRSEGHSKRVARELTQQWVAKPGTSEHELGLAVDINPDREKSGDEVYEWLNKNAHKYGFIKRYPEDKTDITGIANEPWHYRYVGEKAAKEMKEKSLCLEEYIEYIS